MFDINCKYELDDRRMAGVMADGFEKVEAALRERNNLLASKVTVPLEAYKEYTLHAGAMEDILKIAHALYVQCQNLYQKAMDAWRQHGASGMHWSHYLCLYFEVRHILETVNASLKDAPLYSETVRDKGSASSTIELRGGKAKNYLSLKCVVLHIDDLMELVGRCKHPDFDLKEKVMAWFSPWESFHETPAKKAGPLKFMQVYYVANPQVFNTEECFFGKVDGEDKPRSFAAEVQEIMKHLPEYY